MAVPVPVLPGRAQKAATAIDSGPPRPFTRRAPARREGGWDRGGAERRALRSCAGAPVRRRGR